jgi:hypothetical protein
MPRLPHGPIDAGSSASSVADMPANPPTTALRVARNTRIAATIMTAPCTTSV